MKHFISGVCLLALFSAAPIVGAQMNHEAAGMDHSSMSQDSGSVAAIGGAEVDRSFMDKIYVDGYEVTFHVMKAAGDMQHGGTQNLMVMVQKNKRALTNLLANSKVIAPDGRGVSKPMMLMGQWYMAGYDMTANGSYQLMVLFKTEDGQKHFGGVRYDAK